MINWTIKPYISVGILFLNSDKEVIRNQFDSLGKERQILLDNDQTRDNYDDPGLSVFYNDEQKAEYIELYIECNPILFDIELCKLPYSELKAQISLLDSNLFEDSTGFTSFELGIAIYAPAWNDEEPDEKVESVGVFTWGYYNNIVRKGIMEGYIQEGSLPERYLI